MILKYNIDSKFANKFDLLQNIKLVNRKSDTGFSEDEKLMIKMRNWTVQLWNTTSGWWWVSDQFFFTDFFSKRWHLKWYDNKVWRLVWSTWEDLTLGFSWNDFKFNSIKLPMNTDGTLPTEYTTPSDSSWPEQLVKDTWDSTVNPVWQYLIITDDSTNNQVYRWCFASILADENWEYTLNWAWVATLVKAWAKYQIYDTLWEHLQVTNWEELEKYVFWKSDESMVVNTFYTWLATLNLRNVKALTSNQYLDKQLSYAASYWTSNKWTIYYSSWALNNPFFYDFTWALTIPWNNGWDILDISIYKERLIIWWNNFISYIKWVSDLIEVEPVTKSFWITENSFVDLWKDWYFLTTNKQIYSMDETITWSIVIDNVWKIMNNYLKDFNTNISSGYDWRYLYFYGQIDEDTTWTMLVLDVEYKFWSTFTWLRPSSIVLENWSIYLSDNNSDIIRIFTEWAENDTWEIIEQKISLKDIELGNPFITKNLQAIFLWLDNFNQSLLVDNFISLDWANGKKATKEINIIEKEITWVVDPMWEWIIWEWLLWWFAWESEATFPFMKKIAYKPDQANIWKIIITWKEWSPFYLNALFVDTEIPKWAEKYFDPKNTI